MLKTITIGDKGVTFAMYVPFILHYKNQFGKDPIQQFLPVIADVVDALDDFGLFGGDNALEKYDENFEARRIVECFYGLELTDILNLLWAMAKSADNKIKEPMIWYEQFEEFPIYDILEELMPDFIQSLISKKKFKKMSTSLSKMTTKE